MFRFLPLVCALAPLTFFVVPGARAAAPPAQEKLSAEDRQFLDGLLQEFLFDPKGARRVLVKTSRRTVWAASRVDLRQGWLVPARGKQPARVYFTDGESIPAPKGMTEVDFVASCRRRLRLTEKPPATDGPDLDEGFRRMKQTAVGAVADSEVVLAAWLYRLGEEKLAARALGRVTNRKEAVAALRQDLAWSAFAALVHAYMVRADDEALAHGERLLALYPREAANRHLAQGKAIVADLKRRKKKGTFGRDPGKLPKDFERREVMLRVAYLIDALDEVDARQWGQPGGVDLGSDPRVAALIRIGDPAVPALIDVIERDKRLTRSVHFWRDFARSRTVLAVREPALVAVMSILRVRVFEVAATGDNFTARGEEGARGVVERLRAYWRKYGRLPFDERMMAVLTDPRARPEAWREAAENLARLGEKRRPLSTTITPTIIGDDPERSEANPVLSKFKKPTVAEAILAALDRDLAAHDTGKRDELFDYHRRQIEDAYLGALVELADKRVTPVLAKRAAATSGRMRRKWAYACHWLGDPGPLARFARDFAAGKVKLPAREAEGLQELQGIVGYLASTGTADCDRALHALTNRKHPAHEMVRRAVLTARVGWSDDTVWFRHPFCLTLLRRALDDITPTGATYVIDKDGLKRKEADGWSAGGAPGFLADPKVRKEEARERACDQAAHKVRELVLGAPLCHPLLRDADQRLAALKEFLDRFQGRLKRMSGAQDYLLEASFFDVRYIPDIRPLDRPATAEDVKAGRAIFHLGGKGKRAEQSFPASGVLRGERDQHGRPARVLIVQAEVGPDGKVIYGIIGPGGLRAVPARDLSDIRTLPKK